MAESMWPQDTIDKALAGIKARHLATIARVARAICKSRSCEGIACCQWPANRGRLPKNCPVARGGYDDAAQEAINELSSQD